MGSTNKTPNYDLSQFIDTDIPSWLGDINGDMNKIDLAIKGVSDNANTAITTAGSADTRATNALINANTALTNANQAQTTADNALNIGNAAQNTANSANQLAGTANTTATNAQTTAQNAATVAGQARDAVTAITNPVITGDVTFNTSVANVGSGTRVFVAYDPNTKMLYINGQVQIVKQNTGATRTVFTLPSNIVSALGLTTNRSLYTACFYSGVGTGVGNGGLNTTGDFTTTINTDTTYINLMNVYYTGNWN